jgi:hypothetical protein
MKEKFIEMVYEEFMRRIRATGHSGTLPITMGDPEFKLLADSMATILLYFISDELAAVLPDMVDEVNHGDTKYGPHPGPLRAFGALRSEVYELQTEIEAEDAAPENIYHEAVQVLAMAFKFIRDAAHPALKEKEEVVNMKQSSKDWALGFKGVLKILDPDGWDRKNFYHSFNEELITLAEFLVRAQNSTIECSNEFLQQCETLTTFKKTPRQP